MKKTAMPGSGVAVFLCPVQGISGGRQLPSRASLAPTGWRRVVAWCQPVESNIDCLNYSVLDLTNN
ncbi:MAG: hypothetical protein KKC24_02930, partial [Gammaproteobacteria bacterium]|nr:hypothetical protein [Gammaproteobacteria bacterium]